MGGSPLSVVFPLFQVVVVESSPAISAKERTMEVETLPAVDSDRRCAVQRPGLGEAAGTGSALTLGNSE